MKVSITTADGTELKSKYYSFTELNRDEPVRDTITRYQNGYFNGMVREISFGGVFIAHTNLSMENLMIGKFINEVEAIECHFMFRGQSKVIDKNSKKKIDINASTHDIFYMKGVEGHTETIGTPIESFQIVLLPSFYTKYFPFNLPELQEFRNAMENKKTYSIVSDHQIAINHEMHKVINDILQCHKNNELKKMYLECKIIELLTLQLESFAHARASQSPSKYELEKLYAAKEYIENNLHGNCKLIDLAHKFGTNEFTMSRGFRKLFGSTIYQYWLDERLKRAAHLIKYENLNVNEAAYQIGYKNPQHFTAAFKRKYGILPSDLKK